MGKYRFDSLGLKVIDHRKEMWLSSTEGLKLKHVQRVSNLAADCYGYWKAPHFFFCDKFGIDTEYHSVIIPEEYQL